MACNLLAGIEEKPFSPSPGTETGTNQPGSGGSSAQPNTNAPPAAGGSSSQSTAQANDTNDDSNNSAGGGNSNDGADGSDSIGGGMAGAGMSGVAGAGMMGPASSPMPMDPPTMDPPDPAAPFVINGNIQHAGLGIDTWLFALSSPNGATIDGCPRGGVQPNEGPCPPPQTSSLCVSGQVDGVHQDAGVYDFDGHWGARVGFGFPIEAPWDRWEGRVLGLAFRIDGSTLPLSSDFSVSPPPELVGMDQMWSDYCTVFDAVAEANSNAEVVVLFDELDLCYADERITTPLPSLLAPEQGLATLSWRVLPLPEQDQPFEFCIRDLRPILAE